MLKYRGLKFYCWDRLKSIDSTPFTGMIILKYFFHKTCVNATFVICGSSWMSLHSCNHRHIEIRVRWTSYLQKFFCFKWKQIISKWNLSVFLNSLFLDDEVMKPKEIVHTNSTTKYARSVFSIHMISFRPAFQKQRDKYLICIPLCLCLIRK